MKIIKEIINFDCNAKDLWKILTDVSRCDWVPSVDKIIIEDDCRVFEMEGIGQVKEKILLNELSDTIITIIPKVKKAKISRIGNCCWRSDISSMKHETQYTRIFRS